MSRSLGVLTLDLVAKLGGWDSGLSQAERIAKKRADAIDKTFGKLKKSIIGAFSIAAGVSLVRSIVQATAEAEKSLALLDNAVRASGGAAGYTTEQLAEMAGELQKVTTFSDDAVMSAQQLLLRFQSIQGLNFERALTSATNLSAVLGTDLNSAALLVGKALESPLKGLSQLARSGVVFSEAQKQVVKGLVDAGRAADAQRIILDGLESRFAGAATAARDTFGGALIGLQNAVGDLLEAKGGIPELVDSVNNLTEVLQDPNVVNGVNNLTAGLFRLAGVGVEALSELGEFGDVLARLQLNAPIDVFGGGISELDRLEGQIRDVDRAINNSFMGKPLKFLFTNTEDLKALREELEKQRAALGAAFGVSGDPAATGGGGGSETLPSEEFQKMEAALLRQIALYGKTGEAAKVAYDIQIGALDELAPKEQQRILALAQQFDALTQSPSYKSFRDLIYLNEDGTFSDSGIIAQITDAVAELRGEINLFLEETGASYEDVTAILVEATGEATKELEKKFSDANEFWLEAARGTQNILADTLFGAMEGKIDNIEDAFLSMINRLVAESLAAQLATKLFGDPEKGGGGFLESIFGSLGSIFGGGRANGGSVSSGRLYRVNEQGVESLRIPGRGDYLMTGSYSGEVTPASRRSGTINQTIVFQGRQDMRSASQLQQEAGRQIRSASGRLGA